MSVSHIDMFKHKRSQRRKHVIIIYGIITSLKTISVAVDITCLLNVINTIYEILLKSREGSRMGDARKLSIWSTNTNRTQFNL